MDDSTYFLIHNDKLPEIFGRKKELNEMINVLVESGIPIEKIWVIKGKRLQITIKTVEVE